MDVHEFREKHPAAFDKSYSKWCEHACDYDWWDTTQECLVDKFGAKYSFVMNDMNFSLSYSQGDYACVFGWMRIDDLLKASGVAEKFPVLMAASQNERCVVKFQTGYRSGRSVSFDVDEVGHGGPCGMFQNLDHDAWMELIEQQLDEADLEKLAKTLSDCMNREALNDLRTDCEHMTSIEAYVESCVWNEIDFQPRKHGVVYF